MRIQQDFIVKASGGGSNPDPVIYCPANGYIPDPRTVNFPFIVPPSSEESIIFVCNAREGDWTQIITVGKTQTVTGSRFIFEVFDEAGELVNTYSSTGFNVNITFPTNDCYYTIKVTLELGEKFTTIRKSNTSAFSLLEGVIINAPNLNSMYEAFKYCDKLTKVEIKSTCNYLTTMQYAFHYCGIRYFKFANSYPALINLGYSFYGSAIEELDLSYVDFPVLQSIQRLALACPNLRSVKLPPYIPNMTTMLQICATNPRLQFLQFFTSLPPTLTDMDDLAQSSPFENAINIPDIPSGVDSMFRAFYRNTFVKSIIFNEGHSLLNMNETFFFCSALENVEAPRTISENSTNPFDVNAGAVKYFRGPDIGFCGFPSSATLISITGDNFTTSGKSINLGTAYRTTLQTFNCPLLKCAYLYVGQTTTKFTALTTMEVDWANSPFTYATAPQIRISAIFSAAELNRIMGLLPVVSAGQVIDIGYCDGYYDCDKSIALAKGWTVRGHAMISTVGISNITRTGAASGGTVIYNGGYTPSQKGICWALSPIVPTVSNSRTTLTGDGSFTSNATSLTPNSTYNLRAYFSTTYGTVYGEVESFTTLP